MTRVKFREWTKEEIEMIKDVSYSARELSVMLSARLGTIRNLRVKLNIVPSQSAVMSKPRPHRYKKKIVTCIADNCKNSWETMVSSKKRFCSHRCQMLTMNPSYEGMPRPKRNPNVKEYTKYARQVHGLSQKIYEKNKNIINPNEDPRTLCGVEGGWQLDHIIPIKECYERGLTPQEASQVNNLRMLPWKDNLMRQYDNSN